MTTRTFGKRGLPLRTFAPPAAFASAAATTGVAFEDAPAPERSAIERLERNFIADVPFLTVTMILFLFFVFAIEKRFAFDIGKGGDISVESLIALGAVNADMVIGAGEAWRIFLAPILHASNSHIYGNCIALFFVGIRLEPMVGGAWFAMIFVVSALGGVVGSMFGSSLGLPSVGASGAITGLVGALFVASFNDRIEPVERPGMRKMSLIFGVPALLPLIWGATDGTDYFAHLGGAIAGGGMAFVACAIWPEDRSRPLFGRQALAVGLIGLAGACVACPFAYAGYAARARQAALLAPASAMPATLKADAKKSADLVARYPEDPRVHLIRGIYFANEREFASAEAELRDALKRIGPEPGKRALAARTRVVLAIVMAEQGRAAEGKALVADICGGDDPFDNRKSLTKAKLCN